jgi:hypothetical protein
MRQTMSFANISPRARAALEKGFFIGDRSSETYTTPRQSVPRCGLQEFEKPVFHQCNPPGAPASFAPKAG